MYIYSTSGKKVHEMYSIVAIVYLDILQIMRFSLHSMQYNWFMHEYTGLDSQWYDLG